MNDVVSHALSGPTDPKWLSQLGTAYGQANTADYLRWVPGVWSGRTVSLNSKLRLLT